MNRREMIAVTLLRQLEDEDVPLNEIALQSYIAPKLPPALLNSGFAEALRFCERQGWITGIRTGLHGVRWAITDAGRVELNR